MSADTRTIIVDGVDLPLLNEQRKELHELLLANYNPEEQDGRLWGLLEMLDYICDKYDTEIYLVRPLVDWTKQ